MNVGDKGNEQHGVGDFLPFGPNIWQIGTFDRWKQAVALST